MKERVSKILELNKLYLLDCMEGMKQFPNKYFELAIVDPPYGIARFGNRVELSNRICKEAKINKWDTKPNSDYFNELFRVSQTQIIWGANNFTLPDTEYFIVWDKQQTVDNFASAEYAWTNIKMPAKQGDKILDTHVGSASSLIACYDMGFEYIGFELDKDYHRMATERIEAIKSQIRIGDLFEREVK